MKVLVLAGGFARRMGKLGENTPKALLPVAGRPVIEHILDRVQPLSDAVKVSISTNKKFEKHFSGWLSGLDKDVDLFVEPATKEGQKLGSIGALDFFVKQKGVEDDLLVINGDNLFEFRLDELVDFFKRKGTLVFGAYDTQSIDEARKMGVVQSDHGGLVLDFEEKPEKPKSTTVSTGIYLFPKGSLPLISQYISEGNSPDRMGDLLIWLKQRQPIHTFTFSGRWFDIGSPETYRKADEEFGKRTGGENA